MKGMKRCVILRIARLQAASDTTRQVGQTKTEYIRKIRIEALFLAFDRSAAWRTMIQTGR
jgi:hypothetical protein